MMDTAPDSGIRRDNPAGNLPEAANPDPWLNAGFQPDFLVPVQFYDQMRRRSAFDGETRLVFAVLEDAVRCYVRTAGSSRRSDAEQFAEVSAWFNAELGGSHVFSFEYVCDVLNIEPISFRDRLKCLKPRDLPTKQLRSVGRRQVVRPGRSYIGRSRERRQDSGRARRTG
jgi:hypothetical protein